MGTVTLTTDTSWTCPAGVFNIKIECWGGGGSGGGQTSRTSDGGGGGGGGAYSRKNSYAVTPGTAYAYAIGQGGGAQVGNGQNGGDTTFNTNICIAKGGSYGRESTGSPPAGGAGGQSSECTGDQAYNGGYGARGRDANDGIGGHGGSSAGNAAIGYGATSPAYVQNYPTAQTPTGGGHGGNGGANTASGSAPASGNGGGGGGSGSDGTNLTGGAGANGKIILTWTDNVLLNVTSNA